MAGKISVDSTKKLANIRKKDGERKFLGHKSIHHGENYFLPNSRSIL